MVLAATDNFLTSPFKVEGREYCSAENYFQACKATNDKDH